MARKRVVISEFMDAAAVDDLKERYDVVYTPDLHSDRATLIRHIEHADALIVRNRTKVDAELISLQRRLKAIGRLGVGLENIDLDVCKALGIDVIPAAGANAQAVAEYVVCTIMMLARGAYGSSAAVAAGNWPRDSLAQGRETAGRALGIVGLGSVGQCTATLARALGMKVRAFDPSLPAAHDAWAHVERCETLEAVLETSDAVSLHVPLNERTRNLIDASRLALMKRDAILINVARGGVVDEAALVRALKQGHLAGAALDVFVQEPLAACPNLHDVPGLILTPHIAGVTRESNQRVSMFIAHAISAKLGV